MWLHQQYKIIEGGTDDTAAATTSPVKSGRTSQGCIFVLGIVIGFIVYGFGLKLFKFLTFTSQTKSLDCGNTIAEAKARGCEFDVLSYSWIPQECRDRETDDEFLEWLYSDDRQLGPWPFFKDQEMKERIPDADALSHRVRMISYAPQEEHIGHCIFLARRLHRAMDSSWTMDTRGGNLNHTIHCTNMVLKSATGISEEYATLRTHFGVTFGSCSYHLSNTN
ncbi:hypothetical protein B7463_g2516, partial [Scytalidium lignicola]